MADETLRLYLPLPEEMVVIEIPRINPPRRFQMYEAEQLPFPPPYDASGCGILPWPPEKD